MSKALERLARRVESDPFFLAAALAAFQASARLDDQALAVKLGCTAEVLTRLRLCRMPAPTAPGFWDDTRHIAEHFSLDADVLAEVVRHGQGVLRLRQGESTAEAGFLMAARDGEVGTSQPPPHEDPP
ncbi:MAG: hypothetical protein U0840_31270 [Gemmataceae bacterium]